MRKQSWRVVGILVKDMRDNYEWVNYELRIPIVFSFVVFWILHRIFCIASQSIIRDEMRNRYNFTILSANENVFV